MADAKISSLPASTLPLAGTEVLPLVQSGVTKQVATNDLTVKNIRSNATTGILQIAGPATGTTRVLTVPDANATVIVSGGALGTPASGVLTNCTGLPQAGLANNVAGTGPTVIARNNSNQDFTTGTFTKLTFTTAEYDTNSNFSSGTFTPTVAGFYVVDVFTAFATVSGADATRVIVAFYKNGSPVNRMFDLTVTASPYLSASTVFYANGTTDFYDIYVWSNADNPRINGGSGGNQVAYSLLRKA